MPTNLPGTDVVVIGLGAAGGVAVLPLAEAGLNVVGLEAGTWLTNKDFAPDEIRNNVRDWPMAVQKCNREVPTHRVNDEGADDPRRRPRDDERRRRHHAALLGAELAPVALRLQDRERDDEALRPLAASRPAPRWKTGRSATTSSSRSTTASNTRSASRARPATSWARIDPRGNIFEAPRTRAYPMPPLRSTGYHRSHDGGRRARSAGIRSRGRRPSTPSATRGGCRACTTASATAAAATSTRRTARNVTTIPRAQKTGKLKVVTEAHVTKIECDANGKVTGVTYVTGKEEFFQPAKVGAARQLHLRELAPAAALDLEGVSEGPVEQPRPGGPALPVARAGRRRSRRSSRSISTAGTACRRRAWPSTTGPTTTSTTRGLDFIGGGNLWVYSDRRPIARRQHEHVRPRAAAGARQWKAFVKENADRVEHRLPAEDDAALRRQLPRPRSGGEGSARLPGVPHHRRLQGQRAEDRRLHPGQDGALVSRRRRHRHRARPARHDGRQHPRLRRHAHGRQRRDQRGRTATASRTRCRTSACWARR